MFSILTPRQLMVKFYLLLDHVLWGWKFKILEIWDRVNFGFQANVCIPAKKYIMGLLETENYTKSSWRRTRYKMDGWINREDDTNSGNPLRGMRYLDICLCLHAHQRWNLQRAFGRDKRGFVLLSYCSLPQRTDKKKYRLLSNFNTTVS